MRIDRVERHVSPRCISSRDRCIVPEPNVGIGMHGAGFCTGEVAVRVGGCSAGPHHREIGCLRIGGCIAKPRDGTDSSFKIARTRAAFCHSATKDATRLNPSRKYYGHFTTGGMEDRMDSTLPPVLRPKMVPRS